MSRLEREVSRAKPGDEVDLRVYYNGQYRNVKVKAARYERSAAPEEHAHHHGRRQLRDARRSAGWASASTAFEIGDEVRRALETATRRTWDGRSDASADGSIGRY